MMVSAEPVALRNQQLAQANSDLGTFWHRARSASVAARLVRSGVGEVVDVGAGAGSFGGWLRARHPEMRYRFLEPMAELSDLLVARFGQSGLVESLEGIGDAGGVTMLDVLEHIEDDEGFLQDLFRNMCAGSMLVMTVPCGQWLFSDWDRKLGHHRRYSRQGLRDVVESAGFDVDGVSYLFPELTALAMLRLRKAGERADGAGGAGGQSADFPDLPPIVDRIGYVVARASSSLGRLVPYGTSLILTARKN